MPLLKLRTAAALVATTLSLGTAATLATDANAQRISTHPTGNGNLDAYCAAAADLINQAFAEGDRQDAAGRFDEGQLWWDTAIEMLASAKANGCNFSAARVVHVRGVKARPGQVAAASARG